MKRVVMGLVLLMCAATVFAQSFPVVPEQVPVRILLEFSDGTANMIRDGGALPAVIEKLDLEEAALIPIFYLPRDPDHAKAWYEFGLNRWFRLEWKSGGTIEGVANSLSPDGDLLDVTVLKPSFAQYVPNDYTNYSMWGLTAMNCPAAWDHQTGDDTVIISTIDTGCGIYHPDLSPNVHINPGEDINHNGTWDPSDNNGIDDDGNGFVDDIAGYDFVSATTNDIPFLFTPVGDEDYAPRDNRIFPDIVGHGTHTAGTSGAATDNGIGVPSASFNVSIMPLRAGFAVRMLGLILTGMGFDDDFAAAIQYAADNGTDIISISFGGTGTWAGYQAVINYARSFDVLMFAAAGNENRSTLTYPAAYDNVIAVAATTTGDVRASFSNYGAWVDLAAPGTNIWSTMDNTQYNPEDYASFSGTSMASPNAAAVAGLILSVNPGMGADLLEQLILAGCDNIDNINPNYAGLLGAGRVNAENSVLLAQNFNPLDLDITPLNPPVVIPADGGSFAFSAEITNQSGSAVSFDAWTEVLLPNGNPYGPLLLAEDLTLPAGQTLQLEPQQVVPGGAPGGNYTYIAHVGLYQGTVYASDQFSFNKLGGFTADSDYDWEISDWGDTAVESAETPLPERLILEPAYPNPFNPVTTFSVGLERDATLKVVVFNRLGRQVAVIADGRFTAGYHTFNFNGGDLPSGVYFIRANVDGEKSAIRKIVLVK